MKKVLDILSSMLLGTLGIGAWLAVVIIMVLSLPLNVIALMRLEGWSWWVALLSAVLLGAIPIFGQLGYVVLTFLGAYYFYVGNFDWREAVSPTPGTITYQQMTPKQFAQFKEASRETIAKTCKQAAASENNMGGKILPAQASLCDCVTKVALEKLTPDDATAMEKSSSAMREFFAGVAAEAKSRCGNR
ncbi:hypothetical protein [Methylocystis echinoides]|uniref:hypothetical protein n=1 Tax=Methylocystis echinoides TaxID=29468 RepID=UPI003414AEC4